MNKGDSENNRIPLPELDLGAGQPKRGGFQVKKTKRTTNHPGKSTKSKPRHQQTLSASNASLPPTGYVRERVVLALYPVSRSTWWKGIQEGKYPQPIKLGLRAVAWRAEDIAKLIADPVNYKPKK